jgi:hypothetical protein
MLDRFVKAGGCAEKKSVYSKEKYFPRLPVAYQETQWAVAG